MFHWLQGLFLRFASTSIGAYMLTWWKAKSRQTKLAIAGHISKGKELIAAELNTRDSLAMSKWLYAWLSEQEAWFKSVNALIKKDLPHHASEFPIPQEKIVIPEWKEPNQPIKERKDLIREWIAKLEALQTTL